MRIKCTKMSPCVYSRSRSRVFNDETEYQRLDHSKTRPSYFVSSSTSGIVQTDLFFIDYTDCAPLFRCSIFIAIGKIITSILKVGKFEFLARDNIRGTYNVVF